MQRSTRPRASTTFNRCEMFVKIIISTNDIYESRKPSRQFGCYLRFANLVNGVATAIRGVKLLNTSAI